jgi:hypothetical protein
LTRGCAAPLAGTLRGADERPTGASWFAFGIRPASPTPFGKRISQPANRYIPFYLDVGTETSKFTWQALTGLAYAAKQVDVGLLYQYLAFYGSGNQLVQTLRFSGPSLNVTFKF